MNRELSRKNINTVPGAAMIAGAALAVVLEIQAKQIRSEGWAMVYGREVLLVMLIGAALAGSSTASCRAGLIVVG